MKVTPSGRRAARLQARKEFLVSRLTLPPDALPGSLALTHRRCGKDRCHCATGDGHPVWSLTFMVDGKKRVERVPSDWVDFVRRQVAQGKSFKQDVAELFAANAQLLALWRKEEKR